MKQRGSTLSAALLLAGSSIATGYYGIPVVSGPAGFLPAAIMTIIVWLYLLATGLLYLEATLACPDGANVVTISKQLIGWAGMAVAALSFLIINIFYLSNLYLFGSEFLAQVLHHWLHVDIPKYLFQFFLAICFGGVVFWGTYAADRLNFILFIGLLIAFLGTVYLSAKNVSPENLLTGKWYLVVFSVPIMVTAFDYQSLIPTLSTYLNRDAKRLIRMVVIALFFPLFLYLIWTWLVIGSTSHSLLWEAFEQNAPILVGLLLLKGNALFHLFFLFTALFGITTSLISTGLALTDFVGDAFKIPVEKRTGRRRFYACLAVYASGLLVSLFIPMVSLKDVDYIYGWAEVIFNGVIPLWLVMRARYILKLDMEHVLPGGKWIIMLLIVATFFLIYLEGVQTLGT